MIEVSQHSDVYAVYFYNFFSPRSFELKMFHNFGKRLFLSQHFLSLCIIIVRNGL